MLLAIDVGNTNAKFALYDGAAGQPLARWRIATDDRRTADEYMVWFDQLLRIEGHDRRAIDAVIISTVVPRALHNLRLLAQKYFGVEALIAGRDPVGWGIALRVDEPQSVGADRACNAIAAQAIAPGRDKLVVSFGTATTFDHIGAEGAYMGGIIAPGVNLSLEALVAAAAKLPRIAIEAPASASVIGRTTESQMLIGVYWGYVAMIEGLIARMKAEVGAPMTVIATGGLAPLFEQHAHLFDHIESDLTLNGLMHLYHQRGQDA
ncbi:type III pantothenate kinase [Sphingopyxis granuli]|uniref:type III pantothenate kinase n=1 Tax=Sphingopyxis granuli TaxID=267128 RepID=UPI001BB02C94|nr:type III pantothenate kinase [Sphingopyxis granuli]QUM71161.1 type III pantothenate kinase [Sphingopyxis granuli]